MMMRFYAPFCFSKQVFIFLFYCDSFFYNSINYGGEVILIKTWVFKFKMILINCSRREIGFEKKILHFSWKATELTSYSYACTHKYVIIIVLDAMALCEKTSYLRLLFHLIFSYFLIEFLISLSQWQCGAHFFHTNGTTLLTSHACMWTNGKIIIIILTSPK